MIEAESYSRTLRYELHKRGQTSWRKHRQDKLQNVVTKIAVSPMKITEDTEDINRLEAKRFGILK